MRVRYFLSIMILALCSCATGPNSRIPKTGPVETPLSLQQISTQRQSLSSRKDYTPLSLELPKILNLDDIVRHPGYTASYNHTTLCPYWVAYELTSEEVNGSYRGKESFCWDPLLSGRQANREDYRNDMQWDKGHMAPKADMRWSTQAYEESYYLTNICPQNHSFNAGIWCTTEKLARRMAERYDKVYIICGPIFDKQMYGTLGESRVAIPDRFFKALLVPKGNSYSAIAFILNNSPKNKSLKESTLSVNELEKLINRDLFSALDDKIEEAIEANISYGDWGL